LIGSAEDVFAGRNDLVEQDPTVGVARHNLGLGNLHPGSRAIFMQASVWHGLNSGFFAKKSRFSHAIFKGAGWPL
jgi:hypothetical protein